MWFPSIVPLAPQCCVQTPFYQQNNVPILVSMLKSVPTLDLFSLLFEVEIFKVFSLYIICQNVNRKQRDKDLCQICNQFSS